MSPNDEEGRTFSSKVQPFAYREIKDLKTSAEIKKRNSTREFSTVHHIAHTQTLRNISTTEGTSDPRRYCAPSSTNRLFPSQT